MDNNFIKDMRACKIESRLTAEQIGQLTNLDNLYELIDIAYKAGYIACRVNECHRAELDTLVNNIDYINQELLMMQTALPELVDTNSDILSSAFYALFNSYNDLQKKMSELI